MFPFQFRRVRKMRKHRLAQFVFRLHEWLHNMQFRKNQKCSKSIPIYEEYSIPNPLKLNKYWVFYSGNFLLLIFTKNFHFKGLFKKSSEEWISGFFSVCTLLVVMAHVHPWYGVYAGHLIDAMGIWVIYGKIGLLL